MSLIIVLDSGPLGLITNPKASEDNLACNRWLEGLLRKGTIVKIPEIADYEVRRELIRADKVRGIQKLNELQMFLDYLPLTTQVMLLAAQLWAQMRKQATPTADNKALDGDVILAAQAMDIQKEGHKVIIATTNVGHLSRLAEAKEWKEIL